MAGNTDLIVPIFKMHTRANEAKSREAGRPIFDDFEVCEIRFAGDRQKVPVFPAHEPEPNATREAAARGEEAVTYAQVYAKQYRAFKNQTTQTVAGTPLSELPFLQQAKRSELKALNIHTAEALANLDGTPLKQLGPGGRDLKNQAQAYLDNAAGTADVTAQAAEIAELRARLADQEQTIRELGQAKPPQQAAADTEQEAEEDEPEARAIDDLSDAELKAYIEQETGHRVKGNPSRGTLIDRATEIAARSDAE